MIIQKFEEKDYHSLIDYNKVVFNQRNNIEESIKYRFYANPFSVNRQQESLIAWDKKQNIIGQILVMHSEFSYQGNVYPAFLGMDYFVNIEDRKSLAGVILANKYKDLKYNFGIGLTDASLKVLLAFKVNIIGYMSKYIKINIKFALRNYLFKKKASRSSKFVFPDTLSVHGGSFSRVLNADDIVSSKGYWNNKLVEFTRSKEFVIWRYFFYPEKYIIYKFHSNAHNLNTEPVFFVVRPIVWKKTNCLLLVDYRFDTSQKNTFNEIIDTVVILSKKLKMSATILGCSLPGFKKNLRDRLFFNFGRDLEIVSKFQANNTSDQNTIFVTFADSDCDFYYGNNKW